MSKTIITSKLIANQFAFLNYNRLKSFKHMNYFFVNKIPRNMSLANVMIYWPKSQFS